LLAVAEQAQGAEVVQVAFSAAFGYGKNVVGVPERLAGEPFQSPSSQKLFTLGSAGSPKLPIRGASIGPAEGADAAITLKDLFAKVAGVGTEPPFVDAPI
jgi:hypothetical protein